MDETKQNPGPEEEIARQLHKIYSSSAHCSYTEYDMAAARRVVIPLIDTLLHQRDMLVDIAFRAIDDEPEYPGEVPAELQQLLGMVIESGSQQALVELLRISVRLTKRCIRDRLEAALAEEKK